MGNETCSILYIIEYIVVFWLNDILVSTTTQRDGSYKIADPTHTHAHTHAHTFLCALYVILQIIVW
jgi:hypothetical protein